MVTINITSLDNNLRGLCINGKDLVCTHQHINVHFLNIGFAHDNSHKEDFSDTVVQIQFLMQQCPASFGNLLENANFRAAPQTY